MILSFDPTSIVFDKGMHSQENRTLLCGSLTSAHYVPTQSPGCTAKILICALTIIHWQNHGKREQSNLFEKIGHNVPFLGERWSSQQAVYFWVSSCDMSCINQAPVEGTYFRPGTTSIIQGKDIMREVIFCGLSLFLMRLLYLCSLISPIFYRKQDFSEHTQVSALLMNAHMNFWKRNNLLSFKILCQWEKAPFCWKVGQKLELLLFRVLLHQYLLVEAFRTAFKYCSWQIQNSNGFQM